MSGISFNSSNVNTNAYVADAKKHYNKDRAVDLENTNINELKKDLEGAVNTATTSGTNQVFISRNVNSQMVTEKIDLNDPKNKAAIDNLLGQIKDGFKLSDIKFSATSTANLSSSSNLTASTTNVTVTNNEKIAARDASSGKDPQFKALSQNTENFIAYESNSGKIKGYQMVDEKSNYDKLTGKYSTSLKTNVEGVNEPQMQNIIKNDFVKYNASIIEKFPKEADNSFSDPTIDKFVKALQALPDNADNQNITPDNAKKLLSYVHDGQNPSGKVVVAELQGLLKSMTGETGKNISDANNLKIDGRYGFATTLQVRSISAMLDTTPLLKGNPVILMDTSASMSQEMRALSNTVGQIVDPKNTYKIGRFGDTGHNGRDVQWNSLKNAQVSEESNLTNSTSMNSTSTKSLLGEMSKKYGTNSKGSDESSVRAGFLALQKLPPAPQKENLLLFTDEGDNNKADFKNLIKEANNKNYNPVVIYHDDKSKLYYAIDLSKLDTNLTEKGSSIDKMTGKGSNDQVYEISWNKVVESLNIQGKSDIKSLSL